MEDLPAFLSLQQIAAKPRSGEELEMFGKQAAAVYTQGHCPNLSDAVVETIKRAGLSPEQVRRVVEFANTTAYLTEFKKEGSPHRVVHFVGGPADPAAVLQDLNDGGGGTVFDKGAADYALPPPDVASALMKNAHRLGLIEHEIASAFASEPAYIPYENPLSDAVEAKEKLASARDEAVAELGAEESRYFDICDSLFREVKQAYLGGIPLAHVVAAWGEVTTEPTFIKAAFQMLTPRLLENGVIDSTRSIGDSLTKTAGAGQANLDHPLVRTYQDFCESLTKLSALRQVRGELSANVAVLQTFLSALHKEAGPSVAESVGKGLALVPKAWRSATGATARAAEPVRTAVQTAVQEAGGSPRAAGTVGRLAGGAVKYAPHAVAGLAAEEAYQHAKYSPTLQGLKNMALSRVPYTHPYLVRQYDLQQRMLF
jgi:hypothetical protein